MGGERERPHLSKYKKGILRKGLPNPQHEKVVDVRTEGKYRKQVVRPSEFNRLVDVEQGILKKRGNQWDSKTNNEPLTRPRRL